MAASGGASSISVAVRVRPFTIQEAAQLTKCDDGMLFLGDGSLAGVSTPKLVQKGIRPVIKVVDSKCLVFDPPEDNPVHRFSRTVVPNGKRVKDQTFVFDRVFDENASQAEVYEGTTRGLLDSVLDGYNATVFAYGATGCGKTHTITGTAQQPGIIFLTMQELFERIAEMKDEKITEVSLSYLEIYNETIRDLLVPSDRRGGLTLREDANQSVSVAGLSSHHPQNVQEVMDMIMRGNEMRTMSPTDANATSSRSHAVLQINVSQRDRNADINEPHTMATLSIIDLAGSERASATKNRGERLIEGANINKSLLALGSCINALCDPRKRNHVPYRNSKLTRLLKFSLGGNCKTVMIVCVSPSSQHFDETQNTLRYANRAKNIQTKVTRNVYNVNRHVKDFLVKIDEQMKLINELKQQQKDYETIAFAKFRKQNERKESVAREGIARLRSAYEHSKPEREEKMTAMLRLRQVGRRIALLSSWIAAFDSVCATRDDENTLSNLKAIRKTAQGILLELEGTRHHFHQKVSKSNWDRAINSALENGINQLRELDPSDDFDIENLKREAELLKANGERDIMIAILEQEKAADVETMQALLYSNFQTISAIERIMHLPEAEAIEVGRQILGQLLESCTATTSNVVKPDGNTAKLESFAPIRSGTPKRRKNVSVGGRTSLTGRASLAGRTSFVGRLSLAGRTSLAGRASLSRNPHTVLGTGCQSPTKGSPRKRKVAGPRKSLTYSPKKAPAKPVKKTVQWKDDVNDGLLAEYEKTPQRRPPSPNDSSRELPLPPVSRLASAIPLPTHNNSSQESSPIPAPPDLPSLHVPKNNRFRAGFLSKKTNGSPQASSVAKLPPSDNEQSPLRDIGNSSILNRRLSGNSTSDGEDSWKASKQEAMEIKSAMRRISGTHTGTGTTICRVHRRRSPTGASLSSSPANENAIFTASQARRMVKSDKEHDFKPSVLSPRTLPVTKVVGGRRTTLGEPRSREVSLSSRDASARLSGSSIPSGPPSRHASGTYR
ncbi:hypothetical protein VTO42DRAFT_4535 [Malbranchea cinnamomea]